jgi:ABC-type polysaccharide/polyol phosphate transport system ATPase subunit
MSIEPVIEFSGVGKRFNFTADSPQSVLEGIVATFSRRPRTKGRRRDDLWALQNVDFQVLPGQCMGLIGRNGSGKSTALKLIARILRPTTGRIVVRGRVSALLELGAGFHHDLTGRENIFLNASVLGLSQRDVEACLDSIVDFSELGDFVDMPVKHYSSGMFMRLGFSIAVHVEPDVLIVDEILAVGDQAFQEKCLERIYTMKEQGTTILIVSHNARTVRDICTDLVWLEQGRMRASGPVNEVLPQYVAHYDLEQVVVPMTRKRDTTQVEQQRPLIEFNTVTLHNTRQEPATHFHTGDALSANIAYTRHDEAVAPQLEVAIYHDEGVLVYRGQQPLPLGGVAEAEMVRVLFPSLPLLPAVYRLQTAVYDQDKLLAMREVNFTIESNGETTAAGLIAIPTQWQQQSQLPQIDANILTDQEENRDERNPLTA